MQKCVLIGKREGSKTRERHRLNLLKPNDIYIYVVPQR